MTCVFCRKLIAYPSELLACSVCKAKYHYACLNIGTAYYNANINKLKETWRCEACTNVSHRKNTTLTSVTTALQQLPPSTLVTTAHQELPPLADVSMGDETSPYMIESDQGSAVSAAATMDQITKYFDPKLTNLNSKIDHLQTTIPIEIKAEFSRALEKVQADFAKTANVLCVEISNIRGELDQVTSTLQLLEEENVSLRNEVAALKANPGDDGATLALKKTITSLEADINDRDQVELLNDVQISGIPEISSESLDHLVLTFAQKLGVDLSARDIVSVSRVGPPPSSRGSGGGAGEGGGSRPRLIAVRLARRVLRDDLLKAARVRRNITTADFGISLPSNTRVYVNERLTKRNRILFAKAREAGSAAKWRFVWTREGRIYAKQEDHSGSRVFRLRSEDDLACFSPEQ